MSGGSALSSICLAFSICSKPRFKYPSYFTSMTAVSMSSARSPAKAPNASSISPMAMPRRSMSAYETPPAGAGKPRSVKKSPHSLGEMRSSNLRAMRSTAAFRCKNRS